MSPPGRNAQAAGLSTRLPPLVLACAAALGAWRATDVPAGGDVFPVFLCVCILGLALWEFARQWLFSPPALLLGLILGPIAESGHRDMLTLADGRPFAYILSLASLFLLLATRQGRWVRRPPG